MDFEQKNLLKTLGAAIKTMRLLKNISRDAFIKHAGISLNALRHLEEGSGASLSTFVAALVALNRQDYIHYLAPEISINPLDMVKGRRRLRATGTRQLREAHELEHKRASLMAKYGLTLEEYIGMHRLQDGVCGNIGCMQPLDLQSPSTHVDHSHATGKVRSLLCAGCNNALGHAHEDAARLSGLVAYIAKHKETKQ